MTYNESIAIENFIDFCDDMQIAQEGFFSGIKAKIVKIFTDLVNFIERQVKKMKDGKVKRFLLDLLSRAKRGLNKSKTMNENDQNTAKQLQKEADDITERIKQQEKALKEAQDEMTETINDLHKSIQRAKDNMENRHRYAAHTAKDAFDHIYQPMDDIKSRNNSNANKSSSDNSKKLDEIESEIDDLIKDLNK